LILSPFRLISFHQAILIACGGVSVKKLGILLAIVTAFIGGPALAQQRHIPRAQLEEMFANIQAQTTWDIKGNMLWGYFFTSPNKSELEKISAELVSNGYRLVEIRKREPDTSQSAPEWQLHVERVEPQTVDTLSTRNSQFEGLASNYKNVIYDGMDVGPAN
jgi:hypothetical protein